MSFKVICYKEYKLRSPMSKGQMVRKEVVDFEVSKLDLNEIFRDMIFEYI